MPTVQPSYRSRHVSNFLRLVSYQGDVISEANIVSTVRVAWALNVCCHSTGGRPLPGRLFGQLPESHSCSGGAITFAAYSSRQSALLLNLKRRSNQSVPLGLFIKALKFGKIYLLKRAERINVALKESSTCHLIVREKYSSYKIFINDLICAKLCW